MYKKTQKKTGWFMNILDKHDISKTRCCPPHYMPHKFPVGDKIRTEPCHIHKAEWRMAHHTFFCKILKCPNYKFMIKTHKEKMNKEEKKIKK